MPSERDATVVQRRKGSTASFGPADLQLDPATPTPEPATRSDTQARSATRMTFRNPQETMRAEEIMRTRIFLKVVLVLVAFVAAITPILGGDHEYKLLLFGAMGFTWLACFAFLVYIRDDANYTPERAMLPASITIGASMIACNFFGFYSPAPMVLTFGIYFFSLGSSLGAAAVVFAAVSSLLLSGALLVSFGVLPDRGMVHISDVRTIDRVFMLVLMEAMLAITFALARLSRRATLTAMTRLEGALKQVGQREALLQEANQDLERALRGGYRGRWSGEMVGQWKLADVIGRGAMGEVYEAAHVEREVHAAVKLLHTEVQADGQQLARFLREAEVMSQLDSPHVVRVHDVGLGAAGPPYIAMELLRGHDLAWHLRKRRRLAAKRVVEMITQVASALDKAKTAGIVHRDLKPQNLFLSEQDDDGRIWKILDFGVSKLGNKSGTLTKGHVVGTPGYMAPEQARGIPVDHRADVFALAVISYRALTGRPAFFGDEYPKIMFDIVYTQPVKPSELVTQLPVEVELALAVGLAKDPADRFGSAVEFARAIADALAPDEPRITSALRAQAEALIARHPWGVTRDHK
jgi:serine/threonine-protein kinase